MRPKQALGLAKEAATAWSDQRAPSMGAALAYYATFSIAPLLFIAIAIAGVFFGAEAVRGAVFAQLSDLMGETGAQAIQEMLEHVSEPKTGMLATIAGIAGLLLGASGVFAELQSALDVIWRVPEQARPSGVWGFLRQRLLSFGMVFGLGFLVVISLLLSTVLAAFGKWWGGFIAWEILAHGLDLVLNLVVLTGVFGAIFKLMPTTHVAWRDVWPGAALTAVLFTLGKFAIGLYIGKSSLASSFGAFGSLVIVMVWVYYSAQIFLFGAELTSVYAHRYGSRRDTEAAHVNVDGVATAAQVTVDGVVTAAVTQAAPLSGRRHFPKASWPAAFFAGALLGAWRSSRGQR